MEASQAGSPSHAAADTIREWVARFVPTTPLSQRAFDLAQHSLPQPILNHSLRVFIFAKWLAEKENSSLASDEHQLDLLFVSCICHDLGATDRHNGPERFECCGADAAVSFLESQSVSKADAHQVWTAVALHTSPGIAERIDPFTRLVRLGVLLDFRPRSRVEHGADEYFNEIVAEIPRVDIEKYLGDAVVAQAVANPDKAPAASWPGVLLRSHLEDPTWSGVNRAF
ncbi:uncharacterized protein HMPREF1541_06686 [Cyphellophora europaea CBS 101466]|uniref:HD/PDEase domain-containing protein n=1 Tax=Cyphellophora europaea (strain CBS 101466) TaxID=1220924 RepID=W2RSE5_CYPE1|nr:uncharacterized protein HMPREF1541_06686 [Cyphellophora europaea CBS 101466]ETN38649.1 hypothetical protein HMPREF1541_06686 [Cyphellophora europaea CBS 101466]